MQKSSTYGNMTIFDARNDASMTIGNKVSMTFKNHKFSIDKQIVIIERYSEPGRLLDKILFILAIIGCCAMAGSPIVAITVLSLVGSIL